LTLAFADFESTADLTLERLSIGPSISDRQEFAPNATVVVGGEVAGGIPGEFDSSGKVDFSDFFLFADGFDKEAQGKLLVLAREYLGLPGGMDLEQNYPNPFNAVTTIPYYLTTPGLVRLEIWDIAGQKVRPLVQEIQSLGYYEITWDGTSDNGVAVSTGMYFTQLKMGGDMQVRKLMLLK